MTSSAGAVALAFSYDAIDADLAQSLREQAARIRQHTAHGTEVMLAIGRELLDAKARLHHGTFVAWVEAELGMSARSAQMTMRSAEIAAESENFSLLQPSVALKLAAPSVPAEVRNAFVERAVGGERVRVEAVSAELRRLRDDKKEAERVAAEAAVPKRTKAYREERQRKERAAAADREAQEAEIERKAAADVAELAAMLQARLTPVEWVRAREILSSREVYAYEYRNGVSEIRIVKTMRSLSGPEPATPAA